MKILLNRVQKGEKGEHVPETTLSYESGRVTLVAVETAQRPTVLALLATGRMLPDHGSVTVHADADVGTGTGTDTDTTSSGRTSSNSDTPSTSDHLARLRAATAIVDAPDTSEPVGDLAFCSVVQEELMFAGRPSNRRAAAEALDDLGAGAFGSWEVQNVPNTVRVSVLSELAASRPGVEALVLTSPDRRGGSAFEWFEIAVGLARRGFAVLVIANQSSVEVLADTAAVFDAEQRAESDARAAEARAAQTSRLEELAAEHPEPAAHSARAQHHAAETVPVDAAPGAEHPRHTLAAAAPAAPAVHAAPAAPAVPAVPAAPAAQPSPAPQPSPAATPKERS